MSGRTDLEGRLPIVYNGKSAEEWYRLYCQQVLLTDRLLKRKGAHSMGVQIYLVKVTPDRTGIEKCFRDWDSNRLTGDSNLYEDETLAWESVGFEGRGLMLRPLDLEKFKAWIAANVPNCNQSRWDIAVDRIAKDRLVYLWFIS